MVLMNKRFNSLDCICSILVIEIRNFSKMSEYDTQLNGFLEAQSLAAYNNFSMPVVYLIIITQGGVILGLWKIKLQCDRGFNKFKVLMH